MAKIIGKPTVQLTVWIELNENEVGLLNAIAGYGWEPFAKVFKEKLGSAYLERYEQAGPELFELLFQKLSGQINMASDARRVFDPPKGGPQ